MGSELTDYSTDDRISFSSNRARKTRLNLAKDFYKNKDLVTSYDKQDEPILLGYRTFEFQEYSTREIEIIETDTGHFFGNFKPEHRDTIWKELLKQDKIPPHFIQVSQFNQLPTSSKPFYIECYQRHIPLSNDINFIKHPRTVQIDLLKLKDKPDSRYGLGFKAIQELHKKGVLTYTGKGGDRNISNALRQQFKRKFYVSNYEWNIWHEGELGLFIFKDLEQFSIKHLSWPTTLYFTDYRNKRPYCNLKYYNSTAKEEKRDYNLSTDHYKFEITFQSSFFRKNKQLRDVRLYTTQYQIQQLLSKYIIPHLKKYYLRLLPSQTKRLLCTSLGISHFKDIIPTILSEQRTINFKSSLANLNQKG